MKEDTYLESAESIIEKYNGPNKVLRKMDMQK